MNMPDEIYTLVDRFLDGLTTLDEERRLDSFFAEHDAYLPSMPEHLQIVAQMMAEIRALAAPEIPSVPTPRPMRPWWSACLKWGGVVAAIIAAIIGTVLLLKASGVATPEPPVIAEQPPVITDSIVVAPIEQADLLAEKPSAPRVPRRKSAPAASPSAVREPEYIALVQNLIEEYMVPQQCSYDYDDEPMAMRSDMAVRAMVLEYDMMMLEEEFKESEQNRHIIEI